MKKPDRQFTVVVIETIRRVSHVTAPSKADARRQIVAAMRPAGIMKLRIESVWED